jgi:lipopolysaccharide biosynthesis regulator YciM
MEFETWWLLAIPLFFGLGWLAARLDARQAPRSAGGLPDAYFRGLNFLLNEQPDKAIDAFLDVVRLDPETIELHFALGSLFRRRGETERAIRVHQNLAERSDLPPAQREHAVFEVGQDFLRAGLLDRAEDAFTRLEGSRYASAALRHRLAIAQQVRDWPLAIGLAERLGREADGSLGREIAHFHCEMAAAALAGNAADRTEVAARALEAARRADADHPRAWVLRGELALADGDPAAAIGHWSPVLERHAAHAARVARGWLQAHDALGRSAEGLAALERAHAASPGIDTLAAIADARAAREGPAVAQAFVQAQLRARPTLAGLAKLLALGGAAPAASLAPAASGAPAASIDPVDPVLVERLVTAQVGRLSRHVCANCGFRARQFHWQCPGCARWDTFPPQRDETAEVLR